MEFRELWKHSDDSSPVRREYGMQSGIQHIRFYYRRKQAFTHGLRVLDLRFIHRLESYIKICVMRWLHVGEHTPNAMFLVADKSAAR